MGQFCPDLIASPPEFPYDYVNVGVARDLYGITVKQNDADVVQHQAQVIEPQPVNAVQQQQPQQQQMAQQEQSRMQQQQQQPEKPTTPSLPSGWVALQDPSSGMTYYANQNTGESSWDPPQPIAPKPETVSTNGHENANTMQPSVNGTASAGVLKTQKVANKYGDGFVTSASNPRLAEQYGNIGTSNPYSDANRPGTAAAAVGLTPKKAPVSGTLDPNAVAALSGDVKFISDGLLAIGQTLNTMATGGTEKKQAIEAQKGVAVFIKTVARGAVDNDVVNRVGTMLSFLQNRDYVSASSIMTSLVSHEWREHKDWLKGMKILVQMASKKQI